MMHFKFLEEVIPSITIDLAVLRRSTQRYSMLLYQHQGVLFASSQRVGNHDQAFATGQLGAFLSLAREKDVDLALTPEYAVPWECLSALLGNSGQWPAENKLWVLGMESISKAALESFSASLTDDQIHLVFEEEILKDNRNFLDPLAYVFRAKIDGVDKLIVMLQFKTAHMGVWSGGDIERDNVIEGKTIYILRNSGGSQHLLTLICSEAMNLPDNLTDENLERLQWSDIPYLILNPQVNPGPVHPNFVGFRNHVFRWARKEIIELNWSSSSKLMDDVLLKDGSGRSGIFMKSADIQYADLNRIRGNHARGMYYFYSGKNRHAFLLNSEANAFLIENLAADINRGMPEQQMRNGPEVRMTYKLNGDLAWQELATVSDGHLEFLSEQECTNAFLLDETACILEKERLVCLSSGEMPDRAGLDWGNLDKLSAIRFAETTELNRRLTVAQDRDVDSLRQRSIYLESVGKLDNVILKDSASFPPSLARFRHTPLSVGFSQQRGAEGKAIRREYYRYNVVSQDGEMVTATICFVPWGGRLRAEKAYKALRGLFDTDNMNRARVVVYYEVAGSYRNISDPSPGSITTGTGISDDSIIRQ